MQSAIKRYSEDNMNKKDLDRLCRCCEFAHALQDEDAMLCEKKGIVNAGYHCRSFRYDPLKRDPGARRAAPQLEYIPLDNRDSANK